MPGEGVPDLDLAMTAAGQDMRRLTLCLAIEDSGARDRLHRIKQPRDVKPVRYIPHVRAAIGGGGHDVLAIWAPAGGGAADGHQATVAPHAPHLGAAYSADQ